MVNNLIGSSRIRFIKKQIFWGINLFFLTSNLNAMCPQTVGPVTPGEGVWLLVSRIGEATNVIQSQLCSIVSSGGACSPIDCSFEFGQSDVGTGGMFVITAPGTYCMRENVSFSTGVAITVDSNDVTIDMKGHTLDGGNNTTVGIELADGIQNIIIQNGMIENIAGSLPNGVGIRDEVSHATAIENIIIRDMNFSTISSRAINLSNGANSPITNNVLIENCSAFSAGPIIVNGGSGVVRGCLVEEQRTTGAGGIQVSGFSLSQLATSFVIEDCSSTGSFGQPSGGLGQIQIDSTYDAVINNCIVQGTNVAGFRFNLCKNMAISDCIAQGILNNGYVVQNVVENAALVMERCIAQDCGGYGYYISQERFIGIGPLDSTKLVDCIAQNNGSYGFILTNPSVGLVPFSNIVFQRCHAVSNVIGFVLTGGLSSNLIMSDVLFEDCVAQDNVGASNVYGHGFILLLPSLNLAIRDVIFRNCVAQHNDGVGFLMTAGSVSDNLPIPAGGVLDLICQGCVATDNLQDGFSFALTATQCHIFDCCAMNNTGTGINNPSGSISNVILNNAAFNNGVDIVGVTDLTLLIPRSLPGALAGSSRWVNAIS